ncbi:hypothetical protein [Microtetraspora sp. NBRC 13810]|uniref:hypothetical protein n=1 Tax=Microtetraspora sp. NBRC 13810 TaxID=3030990 RepID=UPI002553D53B|nr:hypothetical protein [Microtetraspora sp. NBRC 13810]
MAPHVPVPQTDHVRLTWLAPHSGVRCRVLAWTCHCRSVIYELCASGGQVYLRRTIQGDSPTVQETSRMCTTEGHDLWTAVLTGRAR